MNKLKIFIDRLDKIGIHIKLVANYPWIYIYEINKVRVIEKFEGNHGFTIAFSLVNPDQEYQFTDIGEIFKLIRKYKNGKN